MASIKKRLEQLENHSGPKKILPLFQDLDSPDLWHTQSERRAENDRAYTTAEAEALGANHTVIMVEYVAGSPE